MKSTALPLLALAPLLLSAGGSHGKLTWFEGSYEALLAEAARTKRPVFVDFFTDPCPPCRLLDGTTFSDPAVVEAMQPFLCYALNGGLEENQELSQTLGVALFPSLLFLDPEGKPVDEIEGYRSPRTFLAEVERIRAGRDTIPALRTRLAKTPEDPIGWLDLAKKLLGFADQQGANHAYSAAKNLIAQKKGYDPQDVEQRFAIALRLQGLGDTDGWREQVHAIMALDPEGKSRPVRRLRFDQAAEHSSTAMDDTDLIRAMQGETDPEMLHEGWHRIAGCENYRAQRAKIRGKKDEAAEHQRNRRRALREAFRHCTDEQRLEYGLMVVDLHVEDRAALSDAEKSAVLEVGAKVAELGANDAECIDALACCALLTGDAERAVALAKRCIEHEPARLGWRKRLAGFEAGRID